MPLGSALRSLLINDADVAGIVVGRVYPQQAPQNSDLPCIVYMGVGDDTLYSADGETGMITVLVQFDSYAETYDAAITLDEKVRLVLSGYVGTVTGVVIRGILKDATRDLTEETTDQREKPITRISTDYSVTYDQTVP